MATRPARSGCAGRSASRPARWARRTATGPGGGGSRAARAPAAGEDEGARHPQEGGGPDRAHAQSAGPSSTARSSCERCTPATAVFCSRCATRRCGDEQDVVAVGQEPGQADLGRRRAETLGHLDHAGVVGDLGHSGEGRAEREERDVGDAALGAELEDVVVVAVDEAERVLHADQARGVGGLADRVEAGVGDADPGDLALVAQLDHRGQLVLERHDLGRVVDVALVHEAQVDRAEALGAERAQVVLDALAQLLGPLGGQPVALVVAARADLGDEDQLLGVRVQGLADQLVGHVGAVELRGVDVVDAQLDRAPEHGQGLLAVARRTHDTGAGSCMAPKPTRWTGRSPRWPIGPEEAVVGSGVLMTPNIDRGRSAGRALRRAGPRTRPRCRCRGPARPRPGRRGP